MMDRNDDFVVSPPQVQYVAAIYLYLFDYDTFLASPLIWSVPFTGWMQSVSASLTFTFLPRKKEPGCKKIVTLVL